MSSTHVRSRTDPDVYYTILVGPTGEATCTCAAYENGLACWHIKYILEEKALNETSTALAPIEIRPPNTALPSRSDLAVMDYVAGHLAETKGLTLPQNLRNREDVRAVLYAGWEVGVKPMTALRHFFVVNGKVEPDAQIMAGIVTAHEADARFEIVQLTADSCTMRLIRPSKRLKVEYTYALADAKAAGLLSKGGPWTQYPKDMMRWAATKRLCRVYAPDLINSVSVAGVNQAMEGVEPEEDFIDMPAADISSLPASDLYSAGDEPEPEPAPVPQPEPVTGPAALDYAATTRAILAVVKDIGQSQGKERAALLEAAILAEYPETKDIRPGKCYPQRVKPEYAADLLASLRRARGDPPAEHGATQQEPEAEDPGEDSPPAGVPPAAAPAAADSEFESLAARQPSLINPRGGEYH